MGDAYRVRFTIYSIRGVPPVTIVVRLDEYQAKVLQKTPVKSIGISLERKGGMVIDQVPEPVDFDDRG